MRAASGRIVMAHAQRIPTFSSTADQIVEETPSQVGSDDVAILLREGIRRNDTRMRLLRG